MKKLLTATALFLSAQLFAQSNTAYFLSNPSLSPDGQTVVFSFEGDLWKASVNDGQASRLTAMQGYETSARVSPDGKWIAFTGRQYGNADVYIIPVNGGEVRQITFHSGADDVTSWSWDSKSIYFNSSRMGQIAGFKVSAEGGTPVRIFGNYFFQYDHNLVEHPSSGEIFFNDTWESNNQSQRKRYKGPFNPDIQSYNPGTKQYNKYTDWEGKDFGATIDKNGNIYFISDEANGEYNLYALDKGKKKELTRFTSSIRSPQVNANGGKVVFEKDYQLWLYDVSSDKGRKLDIAIIRNNTLPKEKDFDVRGNITAFDISPDGKKMAFVSRGELFVSDVEGKFIRELNRHSAERVREVKWLSDNKTLLFNQTLDGYTNWYTTGADGNGTIKQLTTDKRNNRSITLSKKRTKAVYLSGRDEVRLMDLKTMESKTIVKDEIWGFQNSDPGFSPNEDYVLFTAYRNFEQDVFVYNIKENKTINLTNTGITESGPLWSADRKSIFLTSQRLKASYPVGMPNARVYRLPLENLDEPYRIDKFNELFKEEKKDTAKKAAAASDSAAANKPLVIDTDLIMERLELVGPTLGAQFLQFVYQKGDKTTVLYTSNHGEGRSALWKTVIEPFEQNKMEKINGTDNSFGFDIVEISDKFYVLSNGNINKLNIEGNKVDPISISYTFRRNLSEEFTQMFSEAWAQMEENYYDEKFHGINWKKIKDYYQQFVPSLNTRADLRLMLNDMLGELNSSHQGFGTFGDDETIVLQNRTMETGIIFEDNDPYKVKYVAKRSVADKKGIDIKPGDVLVKVNDESVETRKDRNYYFTRPSLDRELKLSFTRNGQPIEVKVHPQASLLNNLYDEWIDNNQKRVEEKGKGKIAYGYMKNMGQGELDQFVVDMTQELNKKQALIFDLRYNTGGNVHDEVLKFLSQKTYLQWKYREGMLSPQPNFNPSDKPIILLTNEQSLSDAEMTAQGFKALKLGKIVGNGTYRWIIFTSGVGLVDGSSVRMPGWGCYSLDGKDLEASGVQPDILVLNSFTDKLNGRDPQLDKAIEEILKQL
ncbi:MAG TPA: S41 family peptidase [Chitinophagaceae bacterium]|jgi:C-terminal processing protease CtpA/Prc/Tol biopolymer transport system component|nr:S41 family peptidase [Chitinophagaceae bacterium]